MMKRLRDALTNTRTRGCVGLIAAVAFMFVALPAFAADSTDPQLGFIMNGIVWLFSFFVYFGGMALNASAYYSIVKMGAFIGGQSALQIAWGTFRDIGNLAVLFGFIAMGIQTILDTDSHGTRKKIVTLVIVAVAINFSSLIARGVVDVGNIVAFQFYKEFNGGQVPDGNFNDRGISDAFMKTVRLQSVLNTTGTGSTIPTDAAAKTPGLVDSAIIGFLAVILFIIVAFVFFSLAFLFVARMVVLTLLITISPLAFAAMVVPQFSDQSKKWWDALLKNTLSAPLVMLLLLISVKLLESDAFATALAPSNAATAASGLASVSSPGWINLMLTFAVATGFFVASLLLAKQLSASGANGAINLGRKVTTYPFALANRFGSAPLANRLSRGYEAAAGRYKGLGSFMRFTGLDEAATAALKAPGNAKIGGFESVNDRTKRLTARKGEMSHAATAADSRDARRDAIADITKATAAKDQVALDAANKKLSKVLQGTSLHDIEEAVKTGSDAEVNAIARNVSPEKFEQLMKSKEIEDRKHDLPHARFAELEGTLGELAAANDKGDTVAIAAANLKLADAKNIKVSDLEQFAQSNAEGFDALVSATNTETNKSFLNEDQLEALAKSKPLTAEQSALVRNNNGAGRVDRWMAGTSDDQLKAVAIAQGMNSKEKMKLKTATLMKPEIIATYGAGDINAIAVENKFSTAQMKTVREELEKQVAQDPERRAKIDTAFEKNGLAHSIWGWNITSKPQQPTQGTPPQGTGRADMRGAPERQARGR